ncbi:signal peptidase complex catalytic subunit SEC11A [Micractinium conductrix]|uniref:Signal peptidase complex catalytic subunit SEC11 n=1 Tax=Micractinium conductrix TaxID=554055 RepID=A0A2P6V9M8_9CHLO|nr:signal peptidase complex catalytic subunit SEC11A [Micractinium conductrix]|eukprot:PSC70797.1 signal peptidase complex catalytic subunit SEC11A [Micractinium conductrix]
MNKRQLLLQGVNLGMIITSALMIWKSMVLATGSESPVVVVLSGSMEPGFYRGDILFLYQPKTPAQTGDIIVFNTDGREIPIVHRIIKVHERAEGSPPRLDILTKGDNNWGDDRSLYPRGQLWLNTGHIMGKVVGFLPHIGRVTIIMNDYPWFKYALIAALGVVVVTSKEG